MQRNLLGVRPSQAVADGTRLHLRTLVEGVAMTTAELRAAARRLCLPAPDLMTVNEAQEARDCIGCTVRYERRIRMVAAIRGCPAHAPVDALPGEDRGATA